MKLLKIIALTSIVIFFFCSCEDDEKNETEYGYFKLNVNSIVQESEEIPAINIDNCLIQINDRYGEEAEIFPHYAEMPDSILMEKGDYKVIASFNRDLMPSFEHPYYEARANFTIKNDSVKVRNLDVDYASVLATVEYSDYVMNKFDSYSTKITCNNKALLFAQDEQRAGHFTLDTLFVEATFVLNEQSTIQYDTIAGAEPKLLKEIFIDGNPMGNGAIEITIDVSTTRIDTDINLK